MKTFPFALLGLALLAACDSPTRPSSGLFVDPNVDFRGYAVIEGPQVVAPGETAEFRVFLVSTGGVRRDVTADAEWSVSEPDVASIEGPGVLRGKNVGATNVEVLQHNPGGQARKEVLVLPPGTYLARGRVIETGSSAGIAGALVEVTSGPSTGLSTVTGSGGTYSLYGIGGGVRLRVTRAGYHAASLDLTVTDHTRTDIEMVLVVPRLDVSGNYTLTIAAASECGVGLGSGHLPTEVRTQTYDATVQQNGPSLRFSLVSPTRAQIVLAGRSEPDGVTVDLSSEDGLITERLPSSEIFAFGGTAVLGSTADGFAGAMSGTLAVFDRDPWTSASPKASCESERHQITLSR